MNRPPLKMRGLVVTLLFAATGFVSCGYATEPIPRAKSRFSVLVIGNDLVLTQQLAVVLNGMGRGLPDTLDVQLIAKPGYSLADHYVSGPALEAIRAGGWRFVILQDRAIPSGDVRLLVKEWAAEFATAIAATGARTAIISPYAGLTDYLRKPSSATSYEGIATDIGALNIHVGAAWTQAWNRNQFLPFFASNDTLPSTLATYLTAMVIYSTITGTRPSDLPTGMRLAGGDSIAFTADVAAILRAAATDAVNGK
ncbi:MAG: hypothetical protein V4550_14285 [Gemmatimonadota bacterium]